MRKLLVIAAIVACFAACSGGDSGKPAASGGGAGAPSGGTAGTAGAGGSGGGSSGAGGASGAAGAPSQPWRPQPGTSWQWQLAGAIDTSLDVAMYDIDLFNASAAVIGELHGAGRIVICYFSAGSREDWRSDAGAFAPADYGKPLQGWPGENWLDIRSANVRAIMKQRLDLAVEKQCDGVEPDNVDGYANDSGFALTETDQLEFNRFIATQAHARGLSVGLKNALELIPQLEPDFDWALDEECLAFDECTALAPFLAADKAVFHVEYVDSPAEGAAKQSSVCGDATIQGFSSLIKTWDLDAWRLACP
jgi:endo-alpha-1,4-polygalactosaminidase (GH114 family)